MGLLFKGQHPTFGRGASKRSINYQRQSPYYWWWEFLRRNEAYLTCCTSGGSGELASLYSDFGDVLNDTFQVWWRNHGYDLFAEKPKPVKLAELDTPADWSPEWSKASVMVVAVPLDLTKRDIHRFFSTVLNGRHEGKRGRKTLTDASASTARYPLFRSVSVYTLEKQLEVYDLVMAKRRKEIKLTLAQIGVRLKLVDKAMPGRRDDKLKADRKRSVMAATVSRYFKEACRIVANTSLGQFPNSQ